MSFITKLLKWPEEVSSKEESPTKEESKLQFKHKLRLKYPRTELSKKERKENERKLALNKVNVNTVYNKMENYMPVSFQPTNKNVCSVKTNERTISTFQKMLTEDATINFEMLKKLSWQGIPPQIRPFVWKLLLKYEPLNKDIRAPTLNRKREDYKGFIQMYYIDAKEHGLNENEQKIMRIIINDVVRTQTSCKLFCHPIMQEIMTRILWIWHVRHPASGYVQGMNDLITPFLTVFLSEHIDNINSLTFEVPADFEDNFTEEMRFKVEADTFWCLSKILNDIIDNFTFKSGTEKSMNKIKEIIKKIDIDLYNHLKVVDPQEYIFKVFSLRWLFSLLIREFSLKVAVRLFDTYISDEMGFSVLHLYVCAALLLKWSIKLKKMNLDSIMTFLQDMPTKQWCEEDLDVIIAEAYVFRTLYEDSTGHFATQ